MMGLFSLKKNGAIALVFILLLGAYPYIFDRLLPIPGGTAVTIIFTALFAFVFIALNPREYIPRPFRSIMAFQIIIWLIYSLYHGAMMYTFRIVMIILSFFVISALLNIDGGLKSFFKKYNAWIFIMAIGAAVGFFLILISGMQPLQEYDNIDGRTSGFYGITCAAVHSFAMTVIRVSGSLLSNKS